MNPNTARTTTFDSPGRDRILEVFRRRVREAMPRQAYSHLAGIVDCASVLRAIGLRQLIALRAINRVPLYALSIPALRHPFCIRPRTSDLNEVIGSLIRNNYGQYFPSQPIELILDAGANIGDTTVWYLNKFPAASVIALEPHPGNFAVLSRNCEPYGERVKLLQAALWSESGSLHIVNASSHAGHTVTDYGAGETCVAISIPDLMDRFGVARIDILKCDIEGAEDRVLGNSAEWLPSVRSLVIELHTPASHSLASCAASRMRWTHHQHRNVHYYI